MPVRVRFRDPNRSSKRQSRGGSSATSCGRTTCWDAATGRPAQNAAVDAVLRAAVDRCAACPWPTEVPRLHSLVVLLDQLRREQWPDLHAAGP